MTGSIPLSFTRACLGRGGPLPELGCAGVRVSHGGPLGRSRPRDHGAKRRETVARRVAMLWIGNHLGRVFARARKPQVGPYTRPSPAKANPTLGAKSV